MHVEWRQRDVAVATQVEVVQTCVRELGGQPGADVGRENEPGVRRAFGSSDDMIHHLVTEVRSVLLHHESFGPGLGAQFQ